MRHREVNTFSRTFRPRSAIPDSDLPRATIHSRDQSEASTRKSDGDLKVVLLINSLHRGGAERVVANLAQGIDRSRFDVSVAEVWPGGDLANDVVASGVEVEALCEPGGNVLRALQPLRRLLARRQTMVLHSQLGAAGLLARATAMTYGPLVTIYTEQNVASAYHPIGRILNCLTLSFPDVLVGASHNVLESWAKCHRLRPRTAVIPNGIEIPRWPDAGVGRRQWRAAFQAPDDELVIGTIGWCHERKGQRFLIEASVELLRTNVAKLVIVGDGPLRVQLEELATTLGVSDRVIFTGAQREISGLLASFDIFALPSLAEGMPIVLLEAMARCLPSVATAVGGNADVIRHGHSGLLVQPAAVGELREALETLSGSSTLRARLGEAARERIISEFSSTRMCREYERLYEKAASNRSLTSS